MDSNEANDVFMTDPFLSLDNDLDDVSGKFFKKKFFKFFKIVEIYVFS